MVIAIIGSMFISLILSTNAEVYKTEGKFEIQTLEAWQERLD